MRVASKGFTLAEVLMACFLLGTVSALMLGLFFPTAWMFQAESGRNDVQQSVMLVAHRLRSALLNTAAEWVTLVPDGSTVSMREINDQSPFEPISGSPQFRQRFLLFGYEAAARRVTTRFWPPAPPVAGDMEKTYDFSSPQLGPLTPSDALEIMATPSEGEWKVVAHHVVEFSVYDQDPASPLLTPPIQVKVRCQLTNPGPDKRKQEEFELNLAVTPRCQRW